jgi:hypothetical protein
MKISHFVDFLPGETIYSAASRYLDRMQFPKHSIVSQHFFGGQTRGALTDFPSNIEHLIQALPSYHVYTADKIIDQHTLFPLFAPFLPLDRAVALRQLMKSGAALLVLTKAGVANNKVSRPQWLRYCPACVNYDRKIYGECYWHRVHQVSGVLACPIHEVMLKDSRVVWQFRDGTTEFYSAEHSVESSSQDIIHANQHAILVQLARNANWLLEKSLSLEQGYVLQRYLRLLANRGLISATGRVQYAKLKTAISDYYPPHLLEDLGCSIVQSEHNWLADWITIRHPLHHLLFIQFLCETSEEFFTKLQDSSAPFGHGPWPCLNPLCSHYKERIIKSFVKRGNQIQPIATFTCSCGFAYSRTGPDRDEDAIFHIGRIAQFGDVWDRQLKTYWLDQKVSTLQIARLMHADVETIRRQAARLGLPFAPIIPRRGKRPKIYQDVIEVQRDTYRSLWEKALEAHPNSSLREVINAESKAYSWLNRHDLNWLKEHHPTANVFSGTERLMQRKIQKKYDNYLRMDADLAKVVREIAEENHQKSDFPIRVTRRLLIAQTGSVALLMKIEVIADNLPLTSQALNEVLETDQVFIWRKLRWTVQSFLTENIQPEFSTFLRRARINFLALEHPNYKHLIQFAYQALHTYTPLSEQIPEDLINPITTVLGDNENFETVTDGSLESICINKQEVLLKALKRQQKNAYKLVPILLLTVAAVVSGAETPIAVGRWGYQNVELLLKFQFPRGRFPSPNTIKRCWQTINIGCFENMLEAWLRDSFPLSQDETNIIDDHDSTNSAPGIRILRPYRHIASEVVAKLR